LAALATFTNKLLRGRWDEIRAPTSGPASSRSSPRSVSRSPRPGSAREPGLAHDPPHAGTGFVSLDSSDSSAAVRKERLLYPLSLTGLHRRRPRDVIRFGGAAEARRTRRGGRGSRR